MPCRRSRPAHSGALSCLLLILSQVVPIAIKAAFLNCGQNCASGERFIVHTRVYDAFLTKVTATAEAMRQGPTLGCGEDAGTEWGGGGDWRYDAGHVWVWVLANGENASCSCTHQTCI